MARRVADSTDTTWLPATDDLRSVGNDLLLLAALALAHPGSAGQRSWGRPDT